MPTSQSASIWHQRKQQGEGVTLYSDSIPLSPGLIELCSRLDSIGETPARQIFKREKRKCVIQLKLPDDQGGTFVVKGYPLSRIRNQLRPARFGPLEGKNMLQALKLGIKSPTYLGYFEVRRFGLTKANGVLMESLDGFKTLMEVAEEKENRMAPAFHAAIPAIRELYEKGVNHIDISPFNFMVNGLDQPPVIIDWHGCQFIAPKNDRQLILQAAQFLRYVQDSFPSGQQQAWTSELHRTCSPGISREAFGALVDQYARAKRPGKAVRYDLNFPLIPRSNS